MNRFLICGWLFATVCSTALGAPIKAVIVDGQNNHDWKATTPILERQLLDTDLFEVAIATSPPAGASQEDFNPEFANYDVVVLNYNGDLWNEQVREAFVAYVSGGGGLVVVHAANNAFGDWEAYNEIIGIGGWGGRDKNSGPYVYMKNWKLFHDYDSVGSSGGHEGYGRIVIDTVLPEHPIMQGMPPHWYQFDELYNFLRGPGKKMTVLATSYSASPKDKGGSGRHEPMLFTLAYGDGRIFHTTLGHDTRSMKGKGFEVTFTRGAEWAATGQVTIPVADDIPRPMEPHEAVGVMDKRDSYHPAHAILLELATLADQPEKLAEVEAALIAHLDNPETPFLALQATCNALGILGSAAAVPSLAELLERDAQHASAALLALESIEAPEATALLLHALEKDNAFNRVAIVNSLGRRREASAVPAIASTAKHADQTLSTASINALGKIGTAAALEALRALPASKETKIAILVCAHQLVEEGNGEVAAPIFREILNEEGVPQHHLTAALRGLLQIAPEEGMQQVWTMLGDDSQSTVALNVLGSVPASAEVVKNIVAHIDGLSEEIQVPLLAILGAMGQPEAREPVLALAQAAPSPELTLATIDALGNIPGNEGSIEYLMDTIVNGDRELRRAAQRALARTPGTEADNIVIDRIRTGSTASRKRYITAADQRSLVRACEVLFEIASKDDLELRSAAFGALRTLAGPDEYAALVALAAAAPDDVLDVAVRAVEFSGSKIQDPAARLAPIAAAMEEHDDRVKQAFMPLLAEISSDEALAVVESYGRSGSNATQEAAIAALSVWKTSSAIQSVLDLAASTTRRTHRILLINAFGDLLGRSKDMPAEQLVNQASQAVALGLDTSGGQALLQALANISDERVLPLVEKLGENPELAEEATKTHRSIRQKLLEGPTLSASHNTADLSKAQDGDPATRWSSNAPMAPGMWLAMDLGLTSQISQVTLDTTASSGDYPRGYEVYVDTKEIDLESATPLITGEGDGPVTTIAFDPPVEGRYIKIVQTGAAGGLYWSVHELAVLHDPFHGGEAAAEPAL